MRSSILALALSAVITSGCAGAALKKEMKESRGYSDAEIAEIQDSMQDYHRRLVSSQMASNPFNQGPRMQQEQQLRTLWCNCYKKLKDGCRKPGRSLASEDRALWVKANAVEMAFAAGETALDAKPATKLDGDECQ